LRCANPADVPVADRFVHKFSSDRAIDATANGADNATIFTANFADARNLLSYKLFLLCAKCDVRKSGTCDV
jgi:hypothetical protein